MAFCMSMFTFSLQIAYKRGHLLVGSNQLNSYGTYWRVIQCNGLLHWSPYWFFFACHSSVRSEVRVIEPCDHTGGDGSWRQGVWYYAECVTLIKMLIFNTYWILDKKILMAILFKLLSNEILNSQKQIMLNQTQYTHTS